jgi:thioredoxin 1
MPRPQSLLGCTLLLTLACALAGCGITSRRATLEDAIDDIDAASAESAALDDAAARQREGEHAQAQHPAKSAASDIALTSAHRPLDEPAEDASAEAAAVRDSVPAASALPLAPVIAEVNTGNFKSEVLSADEPVLVDFSAQWCGPCKKLAPVLDQLAADNRDIKVVKVDIDESRQLAKTYHVGSVPTLILFKNGEPVTRHRGLADQKTLETLLAH